MNAGELDEIIEIYKVEITRSCVGEQIQNYKKIYKAHAKVDHAGGGKRMENYEEVTLYDKTFHVRIYVPIKENYIIHWRGKKFRVLNIDTIYGEGRKIIKTEQINE